MPGPSTGKPMPEGIPLQDVLKATLSQCSNGAADGPNMAEDGPGIKCKECGGQSKAARVCGGCWQNWYCSKAHQAAAWDKHRSECKPWKIATHPDLGRYMVVTRDVTAGELIMADPPILIGPKQITEPVCLACYRPVDGTYTCKRCGFPMCDSDCADAETHQPECTAVRDSGRPLRITLFGDTNALYECVFPIRLLALRDESISLWRRLIVLESHVERRSRTEAASIQQRTVVDIIKERLQLDKYDSEIITKILGIIDTNSFEIRLPDSSIQGVYGLAAMLEHSCLPNTHRTFDADLHLIVRAAVPIKRGSHLTSCYTDVLSSTTVRQDHLLTSKFFTCQCPRCVDPTELGTYTSALICPTCYVEPKVKKAAAAGAKDKKAALAKAALTGLVLPENPLSCSSSWKCNSCATPLDLDYVVRMTAVFSEEAEDLESNNPTVKTCELFLEKWSSTFFSNHAIFLNIKYALLHLYGSEERYKLTTLSPIHILRKEALCRQVLSVADAIAPGVSRLRGSVLYELYQALFYKTISMFQSKVIPNEMAKKIAKEGYDALMECARVLSYEPAVQPEGQLGIEARDEIKQMIKWMKTEGWKETE